MESEALDEWQGKLKRSRLSGVTLPTAEPLLLEAASLPLYRAPTLGVV